MEQVGKEEADKGGYVIGTGINSGGQRPKDSEIGMSSTGYEYSHGDDSTPRGMTSTEQMMVEERQRMEKMADTGRESSVERKPIDRGGMRSTMRESPEYREQKAESEGAGRPAMAQDPAEEEQHRGILEKAKDRIQSAVGV